MDGAPSPVRSTLKKHSPTMMHSNFLYPIKSESNLAWLFNQFMDALSTPDIYAAPRDSMRESHADLDVRHAANCVYEMARLNNSLHGLHRCVVEAVGILDRAVVEADGLPVEGEPNPKDLWPEDLRCAYQTPAKLSEDELRQVQQAAGYKPGWAHMQLARKNRR